MEASILTFGYSPSGSLEQCSKTPLDSMDALGKFKQWHDDA